MTKDITVSALGGLVLSLFGLVFSKISLIDHPLFSSRHLLHDVAEVDHSIFSPAFLLADWNLSLSTDLWMLGVYIGTAFLVGWLLTFIWCRGHSGEGRTFL